MDEGLIDTAVVLAGGLGSRLRPLTDNCPKPMLPVGGKPILEHIIEGLKLHGIRKVIISIGYMADRVIEYFGTGDEFGINIEYSVEVELLGTGGAVKLAARNIDKPFFLVWGDNLTDINYTAMRNEFLSVDMPILMALTVREDTESFGVAKLDNRKIVSFVEKPKREEAPSNLINAGIFIIDPKCLDILPDGKSSIEKECFEKLAPIGQLSAFIHVGVWFPTDNIQKYILANENFISLSNNTPVFEFPS